jgi:hypothetical protein
MMNLLYAFSSGASMSLIRFLPFFGAMLSLNAVAEPLQAALAWMAEAQPFGTAPVEQHFGVRLRKQCAGQVGGYECVATGGNVDLRWRADTEGGEAREGYLRLPLHGCIDRSKAEEALGTTLRFDANSVADRSPKVTLSGNHWSPSRLWRVSVAFDGDCARQMTLATPAF